GSIGSHILKSLLATGKHEVTVLTRPESTATFPSSTNIIKVDYTSAPSITSALQGQDFLVITLAVSSPPDLHSRIVNAAAEANVKYIMPNYYGYGLSERSGSAPADPILGSFGRFVNDVRSVQEKGWKGKYVALCCGFWYEFSLGMGEAWLGFDLHNRKVTFYDQGEKKVNVSTWELCGKAVAALLSLPIDKADNDSPALSDWDNSGVYVSSFLTNQREILASLHRVLGTTDADWTINQQPVEERYEQGLKELQGGDRTGYAKAMYAKIFYPEGRGDYETGWGVDNGKLGLEEESLNVATKRTLEMVDGGFGYRKYLPKEQ
ncbi:putative oxidoreductase CipA, partial [Setomelanomma holmii]